MIDVDGETMEHILNGTGMSEQMLKQLSSRKDLIEHFNFSAIPTEVLAAELASRHFINNNK
jgi:hypothetical protein